MLSSLDKYGPILALWVALLALTWLVFRELGWGRVKRHGLALLVLAGALAAFPAAGVLRLAMPYKARIVAMVKRTRSAAVPSRADCAIFPANNIWNTRVDHLPVDPASAAYIQSIGAATPLHGDFGAAAGIPYAVAAHDTPPTDVAFSGAVSESDLGPYRIPANTPVEDGADHHVVVFDPDACRLYELFGARQDGPRRWEASSGAIFDLRSNALRPAGWTSGDAAGLPIFPGLIRYDEAHSGEIRHALRFTARVTRKDYVWPARHRAAYSAAANLPPMGQRFRLRASFPLEGLSPETRAILTALKQYGMLLADNGASWFLTGAPDTRWESRIRDELQRVSGADFEAVDSSSLQVNVNSGEARAGGGS